MSLFIVINDFDGVNQLITNYEANDVVPEKTKQPKY